MKRVNEVVLAEKESCFAQAPSDGNFQVLSSTPSTQLPRIIFAKALSFPKSTLGILTAAFVFTQPA